MLSLCSKIKVIKHATGNSDNSLAQYSFHRWSRVGLFLLNGICWSHILHLVIGECVYFSWSKPLGSRSLVWCVAGHNEKFKNPLLSDGEVRLSFNFSKEIFLNTGWTKNCLFHFNSNLRVLLKFSKAVSYPGCHSSTGCSECSFLQRTTTCATNWPTQQARRNASTLKYPSRFMASDCL